MEINLESVMVIGGCGLLGNHIVKHLLDITRNDEFRIAINRYKPNVIFNTASPDPFTARKKVLEEVNITGALLVVEEAIRHGVKALVHTSSSEVETWPIPEPQVSSYSETKKIGEQIILEANDKGDLYPTAIRLCTLFGEGDMVLAKHILDIVQGASTTFIYAGNATEGHVLAAKKLLEMHQSKGPVPSNARVKGEVFHMTNDDPWPFWDFSQLSRLRLDVRLWIKIYGLLQSVVVCFLVGIFEWIYWTVSLGGKLGITPQMLRYTAMDRTFDISKTKERLGYRSRVHMEECIKRGINWHRSNVSEEKKLS
ncbi:putative sterol-4-alpha-carboxylate 3-dehydrogenase, decarboxylating [Delitschia confertaspora ATCC 74209]|uniref:Sterol-4-alpha-carboxylate 3-dehydrogenase, decarboxylating n=1 Tax=Delitschia confertaspora ATCC 74209 TaxID=1513339 RepID=A0A9P4JN88_9PLEO|nr:putative sterol-4-alpha-carboxylate 3-dehydrogenase, decarboxylating [Delitschia confertaspora ATCC 74209]